jgi:hypothetical protein
MRSWSGSGGVGAVPGMSGHRDAKEVEEEGPLKQCAERNKKDSPTHPNHRALSHPLYDQRGERHL